MKRLLGLILPDTCSCGKYKQASTKGLIDTSCANCGKAKPIMIYKMNRKKKKTYKIINTEKPY
jgi:hypothetical protein